MRQIFYPLIGVLIMGSGLSARVVELRTVSGYELLPLTVENWNKLPLAGKQTIDGEFNTLSIEEDPAWLDEGDVPRKESLESFRILKAGPYGYFLLKLKDSSFKNFYINPKDVEKSGSFDIVILSGVKKKKNVIDPKSLDNVWDLTKPIGQRDSLVAMLEAYAEKLLAPPEPGAKASSADATGALIELANQLTVLGSK